MKCHEAKQLIFLHLDGEATQLQQAHLFDHIKDCANCRNELVLAKRTHDMLIEHCTLVDAVPNGFRESIMARINTEAPPTLPIERKTNLRSKRRFWDTRWGLGLVAGAMGLFFTYSLTMGNIGAKVAENNTPPKNTTPQITIPKANTKLADAQKPNQLGDKTLPNTDETKKPTDKPNSTKKTEPPKEKPIQASPEVKLEIAKLPNTGSVDLPAPLSVLSLIYNQPADNNLGEVELAPKQELITKALTLPGNATSISQLANKLQIITTQGTLAKLWQVDTLNIKAKELDSSEAKGLLVANAGKLESVEAKKVAVSSNGELAKLTSDNDQLVLSIGEENTLLSGRVISNLTWSPDAKRVIYFLEKDKLGHLESFDGSKRKQLTPDMPVKDIAWTFLSNDKMLLNITTDVPGIWELDLTNTKFTALANNGGGKAITANKNGDIAFTDTVGKLYVLLKNAPSDSSLIEMTSQGAPITNIVWQDEKTLLYVVSKTDQTLIWKARLP